MTSICVMKKFLKDLGGTYSFSSKERYIERINLIKSIQNFTWRKDQKIVLDNFLENKHKYYVINGIFGCGKTTLLLGMLVNSFISKIILI